MLVSGGRLIAISRHFILRGGGRAAVPSFLITSRLPPPAGSVERVAKISSLISRKSTTTTTATTTTRRSVPRDDRDEIRNFARCRSDRLSAARETFLAPRTLVKFLFCDFCWCSLAIFFANPAAPQSLSFALFILYALHYLFYIFARTPWV